MSIRCNKLEKLNFEFTDKFTTRNKSLYEELEWMRLEDDLLDRGSWDRKLKKPLWSLIANYCIEELSKNCDLFIMIRFMEAICALYGLDGLETSFTLLGKFTFTESTMVEWINNKLVNCIFKNPSIKRTIYGISNLDEFSTILDIEALKTQIIRLESIASTLPYINISQCLQKIFNLLEQISPEKMSIIDNLEKKLKTASDKQIKQLQEILNTNI